jgi:putative hydrolase of the HAD superfamily
VIIVFDLDDTLYPEITYVKSGFAEVAAALSVQIGTHASTLLELFLSELDASGRGKVFDNVYEALGVYSESRVEESVRIYREHSPKITLPTSSSKVLDQLAEFPLHLVTDGDPDVQLRKIDVLGIQSRFRSCLRTWSFGREFGKPSLQCFEMIRDQEQAAWHELVYVGDDPSKDFISLREVGARTVRVRTGRHARVDALPPYEAEFDIDSLAELPSLISELIAKR